MYLYMFEVFAQDLDKDYKKAMKKACKSAQRVFDQTHCVRSAVVAATQSMENNDLINAGLNGSSLTKQGNVECDVGMLCVNNSKWSALTSLQNVINPIKAAETFYLQSMRNSKFGLLSPMFLCGDAATKWCKENDVLTCDKMKISAKQKQIFDEYTNLMNENERKMNENNHGTCGVLGIDVFTQQMFVTSSSGGIWMKNNGRIGPSALIGMGFDGKKTKNGLIACCCSGSGEYLMQFRLAQRVCNNESNLMNEVVLKQIFEEFKEFISDSKYQRSGGCLVMNAEKNELNEMNVEINWAHNSQAMGIAVLSNHKIKTFMSRNQKQNAICIGGMCKTYNVFH